MRLSLLTITGPARLMVFTEAVRLQPVDPRAERLITALGPR
jgi:hypothetical protein